MRIVIRGTEKNYHRLLSKVKGRGYRIFNENGKRYVISFDLPKAQSEFVYDLLEQNAIIERDVKCDLD